MTDIRKHAARDPTKQFHFLHLSDYKTFSSGREEHIPANSTDTVLIPLQ
jgi:hypothetical protein